LHTAVLVVFLGITSKRILLNK